MPNPWIAAAVGVTLMFEPCLSHEHVHAHVDDWQPPETP
jgi:hypothetical protein